MKITLKVMMILIITIATNAIAAETKVKKEVIERTVQTTVEEKVISSTAGTVLKNSKVEKTSVTPTAAVLPISSTAKVAKPKSEMKAVSQTAKLDDVSASFSKTSSTAKLNGKKVETKKWYEMIGGNHLSLFAGVRSFNGFDTSGQPAGFATKSTDQTGIDTEYAVIAKIWRIGCEFRPFSHVRTLDTKFFGASLGKMEVSTSNVLIGKLYVWDTPEWSASLGMGAEYTTISGTLSMGGFQFPTTGDGWSAVFQIEGVYNLTRYLALRAAYERSNVVITTTIPGVPDLVSSYTDRIILGASLGLF